MRSTRFYAFVVVGAVLLAAPANQTPSARGGPILTSEWLVVTDVGPAGCVSDTGSSGACADGRSLLGATGVTLSPDGANVYVSSETSRSVSVFAREASTGAIGQLSGTAGCVSASGDGGLCASGTALVGPRSVALSPDGRNLYFPATTAASVSVFSRDPATGALHQLAGTSGCVSESGHDGRCAIGRALSGARSAAVSPDGTSVYVASYFSDAVAAFSRNQTNGALTQLTGGQACISETGSGGACADGRALDGARTVVVSPDGRNVYVASETSGAIAVFTRETTTGALSQLAGTAGCVGQTGGACAIGRALGGAGAITISTDGAFAYVASMSSDAVAVFSRNRTTGALTQLAGKQGCTSETGTGGTCADGVALDRVRSVALSPDGSSVYLAAEGGDAIPVFARDTTTGVLTQLTGRAACVSETGTAGTCADGVALDAVRAVAVSPDGRSVYGAAFGSSAVSVFARDATTGALSQLGSAPPPPTTPPPTTPPPPPPRAMWLTLRAGATVGGVAVANEDVVAFDGSRFVLAFDGSDVGVGPLRIDALSSLDADSLLLSFDTAGTVPGITGTVDDSDIVRFDATALGAATSGTFSLWFDGSDVGLTADAHDIDAVERLANGSLLLSTTGTVTVSGVTARDEDVLAFTRSSAEPTSAGSYALLFDGSDVALGESAEDVDALAVDASSRFHLSTTDAFAVPGIAGQDEDVFVFTPTTLDPPLTSGSYAASLVFDGSALGLAANDVMALDLPSG